MEQCEVEELLAGIFAVLVHQTNVRIVRAGAWNIVNNDMFWDGMKKVIPLIYDIIEKIDKEK